eukprot:scaffold3428_cov379-Prasinococcus_capsulatus_cf.AAC.14
MSPVQGQLRLERYGSACWSRLAIYLPESRTSCSKRVDGLKGTGEVVSRMVSCVASHSRSSCVTCSMPCTSAMPPACGPSATGRALSCGPRAKGRRTATAEGADGARACSLGAAEGDEDEDGAEDQIRCGAVIVGSHFPTHHHRSPQVRAGYARDAYPIRGWSTSDDTSATGGATASASAWLRGQWPQSDGCAGARPPDHDDTAGDGVT